MKMNREVGSTETNLQLIGGAQKETSFMGELPVSIIHRGKSIYANSTIMILITEFEKKKE